MAGGFLKEIWYYQYGKIWISKKSCEYALLNIKHEILQNIEKRLYAVGLFLDLRKELTV